MCGAQPFELFFRTRCRPAPTFTPWDCDSSLGARSLQRLKTLVAHPPSIHVYPEHGTLEDPAVK